MRGLPFRKSSEHFSSRAKHVGQTEPKARRPAAWRLPDSFSVSGSAARTGCSAARAFSSGNARATGCAFEFANRREACLEIRSGVSRDARVVRPLRHAVELTTPREPLICGTIRGSNTAGKNSRSPSQSDPLHAGTVMEEPRASSARRSQSTEPDFPPHRHHTHSRRNGSTT